MIPVETLKKILAFPFTAVSLFIRIAGRVTVGTVGFLLMAAGLFLIEPLGLAVIGVPLFVIGLLLTLRAVF